MRYILLTLVMVLELMAGIVKAPVASVDYGENIATIKVSKVDVGMSGFIVHSLTPQHSSILKNVVVKSYDEASGIATLSMSDYTGLVNNALPSGKWKVVEGDEVILAFGYSRALLIAPTEEIYYRISKSVRIQWLHPDLFATILSFNGHPTPLKEDFVKMSNATSVGLVFIYLNNRVFTVDSKSFVILSISEAPLIQDDVVLPFYSRVENIDAAWFGEGNDPLESYEPYYYELLLESNPNNEKLKLLKKEFESGEKK